MSKDTYRIGEAAKQLKLATSVLRYWETEFPQLAPKRTIKGQRVYTTENMAMLFTLKELLHEHGMTIEGARRILNKRARQETVPVDEFADISERQAAPSVDPNLIQLDETLKSHGISVDAVLKILAEKGISPTAATKNSAPALCAAESLRSSDTSDEAKPEQKANSLLIGNIRNELEMLKEQLLLRRQAHNREE